MSKYNFELALSENSSTGIILSKIHTGTSVLEFGCAHGRMTRYMKEKLGCQVYIVEYNKEAYEDALKYAEDGVCDDILAFQWAEKFAGKKFDVILFADILEHLIAPSQVLSRAVDFLAEDGNIYISIPNITHNDVLLKAFNNHFDYTKVGLLDDTHIHFWGLENIRGLSNESGLIIRNIEGTTCQTGCTEQSPTMIATNNLLLCNILKERSCGEVYQFVITLAKNGAEHSTAEFPNPFIESCIYVDTGADFNEGERIAVRSEYSGDGSYRICCVINVEENVKRIRLDPVEQQGCILLNMKMTQGGKPLGLVCHEGIALQEGMLFKGSDPFFYAHTFEIAEPITIETEVILPGEKYISLLCKNYGALYAEYETQRLINIEREAELELQKAENKRYESENECLHMDVARYESMLVIRFRHFLGRVLRKVKWACMR